MRMDAVMASLHGILRAAVICAVLCGGAVPAYAAENSASLRIDGALPGISSTGLAALVAEGMGCLDLAPQPDASTDVTWHFKPRPHAWGSTRLIGGRPTYREHPFQPARAAEVVVSLGRSGGATRSVSRKLHYRADRPEILSRDICRLASELRFS